MFKILVIVVLLCAQHIQTLPKEEDLEKPNPAGGNSEESNSEGGNSEQDNSEKNDLEEDKPEEKNSKKGSSTEDSSEKVESKGNDTEKDRSEERDIKGKDLKYYLEGNVGSYIEYVTSLSDQVEDYLYRTLSKLKSLHKGLPCSQYQIERIGMLLDVLKESYTEDVETHKKQLKKEEKFGRFDFRKLKKEKTVTPQFWRYLTCEGRCATYSLLVKCDNASIPYYCKTHLCLTYSEKHNYNYV